MSTPAAMQLLRSKLVVPATLRHESRRRQRALWLGAALAACGLAAASWALLARPMATAYRTDLVQHRTILRQVEALGHLDVPDRIELTPPSPGRLARILVRPGQSVAKGEILAQLDETMAAETLSSARESLRAAGGQEAEARINTEAARDTRARTEHLAAKGLASEAELRAARSAAEKARAHLATALAERAVAARAVAAAGLQRRLLAIRAPMDGVVLAAPDRVGAAVMPEKGGLIVLGNTMDPMHVDVVVAEADIAEVKPGQPAHFAVPAFPGRTFSARVLHVSPDAQRERSSVTYKVVLEAENRPPMLLPGMTASVRIDVGRADNVMAVREAALRFVPRRASTDDGGRRSRVWRLRGRDRLDAVVVTAGISDGAYAEVRAPKGDLVVGDRIVIGVLGADEVKGAQGPGVTLGRR